MEYLNDAAAPVESSIASPVLRETVNTIIDGKVVKVYKDDVEAMLRKDFDIYRGLGLQYGA